VQIGPGVEISMRNRMMETQLEVSNRTLRSAAAARHERTSPLAGFRSWIGSRLTSAGTQLAGPECGPAVGETATVMCAG
jgi:hypothetical protein